MHQNDQYLIFLIKNRDEIPDMFKLFHNHTKSMYNAKVQVLYSNDGGEYTSKRMQTYLYEKAIEVQTSCTYTPEQNGITERKNRHLLEVSGSFLFGMNIPKKYYLISFLTATYIINRLPTRLLGGKSRLKTLIHKPNSFLVPPEVLEHTCFVHVLRRKRDINLI